MHSPFRVIHLLSEDRATRSNVIREDWLPALKQVITSDVGMCLYRNQVFTEMNDVKAELEHQLSNEGRVDGTELLNLLVLAELALERWLSLIDPNDVKAEIELFQQN